MVSKEERAPAVNMVGKEQDSQVESNVTNLKSFSMFWKVKGNAKGRLLLLFCLTGNEEFPMSRKGDLFGATSTLLVQLPSMKLEFDGVITLNEPYKTLVPASLYHCHGINRLVIPTRDYCFAPSLNDTCCAADFIHASLANAYMDHWDHVHA
ncbi:unnamed protein product [Prunus armeniaca]